MPLFFMRYTGTRVVELVHIRVRDFRFDLGKVFVWTAKNKANSKLVGCKCGGYVDDRAVRDSIPFKAAVAKVAQGWIEYAGLSPDDWLFPSRRNRRRHLTMARIRQIFTEAAKLARIPKIPQRGPHSLRHLVGTEVAEATQGNPYKIQAFLRQGDVSSAQAYVHVRDKADIAEQIGGR